MSSILRRAAIGLFVCCCTALSAQSDTLIGHYLCTITQHDLRRHLEVIASDAYEGRETGLKGQKMAATYLRTAFQDMGIPPVPDWQAKGLLEPGYEQPFDLEVLAPGALRLVVDGTPTTFLQDQFHLNQRVTRDTVHQEIIVVGRGGPEAYGALDVKGRAVLVVDPGADNVQDRLSSFFSTTSRCTAAARSAGASLLIYATPDAPALMKELGHYLSGERMSLKDDAERKQPAKGLQLMIVDRSVAERILARGGLRWKQALRMKRVGRSIPCTLSLEHRPQVRQLRSENVLGYVQGTDLQDELVVVTAHYDHIGVDGGEVYNGADDDGSGTVALLEMADAFVRARNGGHGPRRSVLFMPVSGEEKGLLGSQYYSENPVFPLENTIADLNIDMIGRVDSMHATSAPYVYIIGSDRLSTQLHRINEEANAAHVKLDLDYTFNAANDPNRFYYRSDHYNFARKGVPVIFYFSGVHEDYHQPGDEVDRIRFDLLEQRARLVFATAWELANRDERILVDKPVERE